VHLLQLLQILRRQYVCVLHPLFHSYTKFVTRRITENCVSPSVNIFPSPKTFIVFQLSFLFELYTSWSLQFLCKHFVMRTWNGTVFISLKMLVCLRVRSCETQQATLCSEVYGLCITSTSFVPRPTYQLPWLSFPYFCSPIPDCWLEPEWWLGVSIRKVLRPATLTQVFLRFPGPRSKCWDGSQDSNLPLHASHVALPT